VAHDLNDLRWTGGPGWYEVHFLELTDAASGTGVWIRQTVHAPEQGEPACGVWFMASTADGERVTHHEAYPIGSMDAASDPFRLVCGSSELTDRGIAGTAGDASWELRWEPSAAPGVPVDPIVGRARIAKTMLAIPHPDLRISGTVRFGGRELQLDGARGEQAHLWGTQHAGRWGWLHAAELATLDGERRPDDWIDLVSVVVPRAGREIGPITPVVGRLLGDEFRAVGPVSLARGRCAFGLSGLEATARTRSRKVVVHASAPPLTQVGVRYDDPDGTNVWCANTALGDARIWVWDRRGTGWMLRETLEARGTAHVEYAQREPIAGVAVDAP
jgi:hypothetical protein